MESCQSVAEIRDRVRAHRRAHPDSSVGFVPTMGALHEGHLSLIRLARAEVGPDGLVVASIFVNPTQFAPHEDFDSYPRDLDSDLAQCQATGANLVFLPATETIYEEDASVTVQESTLSQGLCGASRPHFFGGVCTVVAKLFQIVQPDLAVFGEKDFQQLAIIRRMVRDLHFPLRIVSGPIVREPDGLAMSSRNAYLTPSQRTQALVLSQSLQQAEQALRKGERDCDRLRKIIRDHIETASEARVDYIEIVDPDSLQPVETVSGQVLFALAVCFGPTRLIDNLCLRSLES